MRRIAPLVASVFVAAPALAADLVVSAGQSIQQAIVAAASGDRVLVEPGTYHEAIDTLGKHVEIIGVGGAAVTILDASGLATSVVMLHGIFSVPRISGFTLTHGSGSVHPDGTFGGGGVIDADGTGAMFSNCVLRENDVAGAGGTGGGALGRIHGTFGAIPVFRDCAFVENAADRGGGAAGWIRVERCHVAGNSATRGGGLYRVGIVLRSTIRANTAAFGGGIEAANGAPDLCLVEDNVATVEGGGLYIEQTTAPGGYTLQRCRVFRNSAPLGGGASLRNAGGLFPFINVEHCVFAGNTSASTSDGLRTEATAGTVSLRNCTLHGDRWVTKTSAGSTVRFSILRGAAPPLINDGGSLVIDQCDIAPGFSGNLLFDLDPLYVDAAGYDFHLLAQSPCIGKVLDTGSGTDFDDDPLATPFDVGADQFARHLAFAGTFAPGSALSIDLYGPANGGPNLFFASTALLASPVTVGVGGKFHLALPLLFPAPIALPGIPASGALVLPATLPASAPPGLAIHAQVYFAGGALSNPASLLVH